MARRRELPLSLPPRLLNPHQAAAYCGVSREVFQRDLPVPPVRVFDNRVLWDRMAIDRWLDGIMNETQPMLDRERLLSLLDQDEPKAAWRWRRHD